MNFAVGSQLDSFFLDTSIDNRFKEENNHSYDEEIPQSSNQRFAICKSRRFVQNFLLTF